MTPYTMMKRLKELLPVDTYRRIDCYPIQVGLSTAVCNEVRFYKHDYLNGPYKTIEVKGSDTPEQIVARILLLA
jgi:hypothetical protein